MVDVVRCHLCEYIFKVEPQKKKNVLVEYMWDYGRKRLFHDFWPEANWEVGVLSLTAAMSKTGWRSFKVNDWNSVLVMLSLR